MSQTVLQMLEPDPIRSKAAGALRRFKRVLGIPSYMRTEDRRVLERVIFPYFLADAQFQRILFVGCHWFTQGYNRSFEAEKSYWTIDVDPGAKSYGGKQHIVDSLQNIGTHFQPGSLDLILCNGVFGWGLDGRKDVEDGFAACHTALRPGGVLVVGWNDLAERRPFPIEDCQSLKQFKDLVFLPLGTARYHTDTPYRHVFDFHVKP